MIVWDENKRQTNLAKHGFDFADAHLVLENPDKITMPSPRRGEDRQMDIAMIPEVEMILPLVYVSRGEDLRLISFRIASRNERRLYEESHKELD